MKSSKTKHLRKLEWIAGFLYIYKEIVEEDWYEFDSLLEEIVIIYILINY